MRTIALLGPLALAACGEGSAPEARPEPAPAAAPRTVDKGEGCRVEITREGAGPVAVIGDEVTLAYEARLQESGQTVASTHGWDAPCRLRLGEPGVLPGLSRGVEGLRTGSTARIEVPPALAYGEDGCPESNVPADAILVFEVEILGVRR